MTTTLIDPRQLAILPTDKSEQVELILAVHRVALTKVGVGIDGIYNVNFDKVDPSAFAYLPRHIVDDKTNPAQLAENLVLGRLYPQVLPYFQIRDVDGNYLVYRRKGKEKGLLGKYSIGVGGHVDNDDRYWMYPAFANASSGDVVTAAVGLHTRNELQDIAATGARRELLEEINFKHFGQFNFERIISTFEDDTSVMHIALIQELHLNSSNGITEAFDLSDHNLKENLKFEESEFPGVEWLSVVQLKEMLKDPSIEFETWSRLLIQDMSVPEEI